MLVQTIALKLAVQGRASLENRAPTWLQRPVVAHGVAIVRVQAQPVPHRMRVVPLIPAPRQVAAA